MWVSDTVSTLHMTLVLGAQRVRVNRKRTARIKNKATQTAEVERYVQYSIALNRRNTVNDKSLKSTSCSHMNGMS